jgi:hypothetical protein
VDCRWGAMEGEMDHEKGVERYGQDGDGSVDSNFDHHRLQGSFRQR